MKKITLVSLILLIPFGFYFAYLSSVQVHALGKETNQFSDSSLQCQEKMLESLAVAKADFHPHLINLLRHQEQQSVTIAKLALSQLKHPQLIQVAQEIVASDEAHVQKLNQFRIEHPYDPDSEHSPVRDCLTKRLEVLSQTHQDFETVFLNTLSANEQDTIAISEEALKRIQDSELKTYIRSLIKSARSHLNQLSRVRIGGR